jgi:hypothetical protein
VERLCGASLWSVSVERLCGASLWSVSVECFYGVFLWSVSVERLLGSRCRVSLWRKSMGRRYQSRCGALMWIVVTDAQRCCIAVEHVRGDQPYSNTLRAAASTVMRDHA